MSQFPHLVWLQCFLVSLANNCHVFSPHHSLEMHGSRQEVSIASTHLVATLSCSCAWALEPGVGAGGHMPPKILEGGQSPPPSN